MRYKFRITKGRKRKRKRKKKGKGIRGNAAKGLGNIFSAWHKAYQ